MRIGLVVDSACDLPPEFFDQPGVHVLPIPVNVAGERFLDTRDLSATQRFYAAHLANQGHGDTAPLGVEEIKAFCLKHLVVEYDFVFLLTLMSSRSPIFANCTQASLEILSEYKPLRAKAGVTGPFSIRVVDSQALFAGEGVVALEALKLIRSGASPNRVRERIELVVNNVYTYMLPSSLYQLRARAGKKGDKSVGWLKYVVGSALDIKPLIRGHRNETAPIASLRHFDAGVEQCFDLLRRQIRVGLLTPHVVLSFAGDLAEVSRLPGYREMMDVAHDAKIEVSISRMSMTGAINVGEGALCFAFAALDHSYA